MLLGTLTTPLSGNETSHKGTDRLVSLTTTASYESKMYSWKVIRKHFSVYGALHCLCVYVEGGEEVFTLISH